MPHFPRCAPALALACSLLAAPAAARQPAADAPRDERYIRVRESADGGAVRLELSARTFVRPDGAGPAVHLVGAVHVADRAFYEALQAFLDTHDVVLFEGVKPPGAGRLDHEDQPDDSLRARVTTSRVRLVGILVERYRRRHGQYPAALADAHADAGPRLAGALAELAVDAWGNPLEYTVAHPADLENAGHPRRFDLLSLGSDGAPSGAGHAADIRLSDQPPLKKAELAIDADGIQQQLADALGLVFQLDAMRHAGAAWRNSDLAVDQIERRLSAAGADPAQLFGMLDGSSLTARFASFILKLVGSSTQLSTMMKAMMVEVLAAAEELLAAMPGETATLMRVIIEDRNRVVIDDLAAIIQNEPAVRSVGIIYGAGHLADLEKRLAGDLGFQFSQDRWFTAIEADLSQAGMSPRQARALRDMVRRQVQAQLKAAKRAAHE